jgi:hypothetical protein
MGRCQACTDARRVHFNTEEVLLRTGFRHGHQRCAHTEANLQRDRRFAKQGGKIERLLANSTPITGQ